MAKMTRALAVSGLVVAATWGSGAVHAQRSAGLNTTQTIQISSATKVLDLGSGGSGQAPPNWTTANFDDSSWQPATQVSSDVVSCAVQNRSELAPLQSTASYWGATGGDDYLFRQTFTLPNAKSYYGSTFVIGGDFSNPYLPVYVNNPDVNNSTYDIDSGNRYQRFAVGQYLHPGVNVIAFYGQASSDTTSSNQPCSMLNFTMNIVITGVQTNNPPQQKQATMATTLPGSNAVLTGNSLPFSWNRFSGASYYYLQMWMDNAGPGQRITSRTTTMYSARLTGTGFNLNVSHFAKGTYSWRMAAVGGAGNLLTVWTPDQRVTLR